MQTQQKQGQNDGNTFVLHDNCRASLSQSNASKKAELVAGLQSKLREQRTRFGSPLSLSRLENKAEGKLHLALR